MTDIEKRKAAIAWWNGLDTDVLKRFIKHGKICRKHIGSRVIAALTGREIQLLWEKEKEKGRD